MLAARSTRTNFRLKSERWCWQRCKDICFWSGGDIILPLSIIINDQRAAALPCHFIEVVVESVHQASQPIAPTRRLAARCTLARSLDCCCCSALWPSSSFSSFPHPISTARPPSRAPSPTTMHKISNFTGSARHGWEKMTPSTGFPFSRSNHEMPVAAPIKRPSTATSAPPVIAPGTQVNLSFNVPFSSNLAGPDPDDIMWASPGAKARWTHPEGTAEATPTHKLPVHAQNVDNLRTLCRDVSEASQGQVSASVTSAESKPLPGLQRGPLRALVTNVCLSGELEVVNAMRSRILNSTPISLVGFSWDSS